MALKSARLEIYIYSGTAGSYTSSDLKYTLDKDLISGQTNIIFEIGNLVRDYLTHDFNNQTPEVFEKMFFLINTHFPKNKKSKKLYWQEYRKNCVKAQKRF